MKKWIKVAIPVAAVALLVAWHVFRPERLVVKHSAASVVACNILDWIPMSEIGMAVRKGTRAPVVDNFRSFALEKLGRARKSSRADES